MSRTRKKKLLLLTTTICCESLLEFIQPEISKFRQQ